MWSQFCGSSNLLDPAENIYCGAQVLSHLKDRCGDELCALKAYNIGLYSDRIQAAWRYVAKIDRAREQLRSLPEFADTPIVFLTGLIQEDELDVLRSYGAADIILKPFDPITLADRVAGIWESLNDR